jgi:phosphoribosylanthranilate isomerase
MSLWIKVCGNTTLADALLAAEAGADAVGFVFAPSPRRVNSEQVARITPHLPKGVEKIGVFVDTDFFAIASAVDQCGLTGVQLHSQGQPELTTQLRQRFGAALRILQVIHFADNAGRQLQNASENPQIDAVLVDSRTANAVGGTGISFDWAAARETLFTADCKLKLIAAGGLNPGNVSDAIVILKPWGVDVVTGVEFSPGHKDPLKVSEFIAKARRVAH